MDDRWGTEVFMFIEIHENKGEVNENTAGYKEVKQ